MHRKRIHRVDGKVNSYHDSSQSASVDDANNAESYHDSSQSANNAESYHAANAANAATAANAVTPPNGARGGRDGSLIPLEMPPTFQFQPGKSHLV